MLMLLALAAQTVALDSDRSKAANTCLHALRGITAREGGPPLQMTAQVVYLATAAIQQSTPADKLLTVASEYLGVEGTRAVPPITEARATMVQCDARFPLARSTQAPTLPANADDRDLMCAMAVSVLMGAAEDLAKDGKTEEKNRLQAAADHYQTQFALIIQKRSIETEEAATGLLSRALSDSMIVGNTEAIATSCIAAMPR